MTGIKIDDYVKANGVSEEKVMLYLNKGYLKGSQQDGVWHIVPSPLGLLLGRMTDSPFGVIKQHKTKLVAAAILLGFFFTNPGREQHMDKVSEQFQTLMSQGLAKDGKTEGAFSEMGMQFGMRMAMSAMDYHFDYHNFLIASYVSFDGKPVTYGIAGMVFGSVPMEQMGQAMQGVSPH